MDKNVSVCKEEIVSDDRKHPSNKIQAQGWRSAKYVRIDIPPRGAG